MNEITRSEQSARLEALETRMDGRLASIEQLIDAKFSGLEAMLQRSRADTIMWVAGIVLAAGAVGLAVMTLVISISLH
jgi:hypothetical protein